MIDKKAYSEYCFEYRMASYRHIPLINDEFKEVMDIYARQQVKLFEKVINHEYLRGAPKLRIKLELYWDPKRSISRGGLRKLKGWVGIAMCHATLPVDFIEYKAFMNDPKIGFHPTFGIHRLHLRSTLAHECAHAGQHWIRRQMRKGNMHEDQMKATADWRNPKPHGRAFQNIYRYLRVNFINPDIDEWARLLN